MTQSSRNDHKRFFKQKLREFLSVLVIYLRDETAIIQTI
tara:strand:- start:5389 stop:5505 length:117 start_codon:yes stop_codon:yes gene_type:complete